MTKKKIETRGRKLIPEMDKKKALTVFIAAKHHEEAKPLVLKAIKKYL